VQCVRFTPKDWARAKEAEKSGIGKAVDGFLRHRRLTRRSNMAGRIFPNQKTFAPFKF